MTRGRSTRLAICRRLYGAAGPALAERIERRLLDAARARAGRWPPRPGPRWSERDAWLLAYPDQVHGGGLAPLSALGSLLDRIGHGLSGLHVLPFHPSTSDGGFAVADHTTVDPAFGRWGDVEALAGRVDLMVDAVVNHTSASHPWFAEFLRADPSRRNWYRVAGAGADLTSVVRPRTGPLTTRFERPDGASIEVWTTFSADQVDLDHRAPAVCEAIVDMLCTYLEHGVRAIRLDAVAYVWKQEGTTCLHRPETHLLVQLWRSCLDAVDPAVVLVTETNVPHAENVSYLGTASAPEAHAIYQFALPPLVLHTFVTGDPGALIAWSARAGSTRPDATVLSLLGSHDGVGVRPLEGLAPPAAVDLLVALTEAAGGAVNRYRRGDGIDAPYELACTWFDLMAVGGDEERAVARHLASHALALALPGIPLLYAPSLLGASCDRVRYERTGAARELNRPRFDLDELSAELAQPGTRARRCRDGLTRLLAWRRRSPAFHPEAPHHVWSPSPGVVAVARQASTGERALVLVEVAGRPATVARLSERWRRAADGEPVGPTVVLEPHDVVWLLDHPGG